MKRFQAWAVCSDFLVLFNFWNPFFTEWTMVAAGSRCSNMKIFWRRKNEPLSECKAFCKVNGALALVYREDNGNCACCEDPPILISHSLCSVYTLPGINYSYASFQ